MQEWKNTLLRGADPASLEKYWAGFKNKEQDVQAQIARIRARSANPKANELMDNFVKAHRAMGDSYSKGLEAFKSSKFDSRVGDAAVKGVDRAPTDLLSDAVAQVLRTANEESKGASDRSLNAISTAVVLAVVAITISFAGVLWMIQITIHNPTQQLLQGLGRLAECDFSVPLILGSKDELGEIAASAEMVRRARPLMPGSRIVCVI